MTTIQNRNSRLLGNVRVDGSDVSSCWCFKLTGAMQDTKVSLDMLREYRRHVYAPCWQCEQTQGCIQCKENRPGVCEKCGAYVNKEAFCLYGDRLPEDYRDRHPTGWRLLYYALYGIPEGQQMYVRIAMRDEKNFAFCQRVGRHLGLPPEHLAAMDPAAWKPTNPWKDIPHYKGHLNASDEESRQDMRAAAYAKPVTPIGAAIPRSFRVPLRVVHDAKRAAEPARQVEPPPPLPANDDPFFDDVPPPETPRSREPGEEG